MCVLCGRIYVCVCNVCVMLLVCVCVCVCVPHSLMQRRFSEPNNYIDSLPSVPHGSDDLYDDVPSIEADPEVSTSARTASIPLCRGTANNSIHLL